MNKQKERFPGIPNADVDYYQTMLNWKKDDVHALVDSSEKLKYVYSDIAGDSRNFLGIGSFDRKFGNGYLVKNELLELIKFYQSIDGLNNVVLEKLDETRRFIESHNLREMNEWLALRELYFQAGDEVQIRIYGIRPDLVYMMRH